MARLQTPEKTSVKASTPKELESLIRSMYEHFNDHDLDKLSAMFADDCEWLEVPTGRVFRGPDGAREFDGGWMEAFPDARIEVTNLLCQGDMVVTEFIGRGTHGGPLKGASGSIPATNKRVELRLMDVFQFRGKQIMRARTYYDALTMLRQIGAVE
jgi:steroid delta-isomerase-like uncharacterized protein